MSFLTLTPYYKIGETVKTGFETDKAVIGDNTVIDENNQQILNTAFNNDPLTLRVTDNVEVTRGLKKTPVDLYNTNGGKSGTYFYISGDTGYKFKIKVICIKTDKWFQDKTVLYWLDYYYRTNRPMSVVIGTDIVPNDIYYISDFTKRETIRKDYWEFEMEFTSYVPLQIKIQNKVTVLQSYLKKCKMPKNLKLPVQVTLTGLKKEKTTHTLKKGSNSQCIYYMNQALYKKGCLTKKYATTKYTKQSKKALIQFQKRWNKKKLKPKVNTKGKMDKNTWKAIQNYVKL